MESKDWFYIIGIAVSVILGFFNLYFLKINRRNALREHLYKEQLNLCLKLPEKFSVLSNLFYDCSRTIITNDQIKDDMDKLLAEIELLTEQAEIIMPDELITQLTKTELLASRLSVEAFEDRLTKERIKEFHYAYFDLTDLIREHIGVDKLSLENKKMANR